MRKITLFVSILLFLFGCTDTRSNLQTLEFRHDNPQPQPAYIERLENFGERICIEVDLREVWIEGDTFASMQEHLRSNTTFFVDGFKYSDIDMSFHLAPAPIFDANNQFVTTIGSPMLACITDLDTLSSGLHLGRIEFTSTDSVLFDYEWTFVIE